MEILEKLIAKRYPVYGQANVSVDSADGPPEATVERVRAAIEAYLAAHPMGEAKEARLAEDAGR